MPKALKIDEQYLDYCTVHQRKVLEAIIEYGSAKKADEALGLWKGGASETYTNVRRRAAKMGYAPEYNFMRPVPDGYVAKGVSTYYNKDGNPTGQWVKASLDAERQQEMFAAAVNALANTLPRLDPIVAPEQFNADLLTMYTLTDAHIGMLAWHRENMQADWDLQIAEAVIVGCFEQIIKSSPDSEMAILNQLGDLLHYDGLSAVTPTSGHVLDADGRFTKMVEVAVRVLRRIITMLLAKHTKVHVILAEGNHDMASSVWLRTMFKALYENEPRITVDDSALPYYAYEFGDVMLTFHHSHLKKFGAMREIIPAMFSEIWGRTKKRYCHTGNYHHTKEEEHAGMKVFQHPTLAARDAYASRGAWFSDREVCSITYHKKFGQGMRVYACPEMLDAV
jgi:hypothetical protein